MNTSSTYYTELIVKYLSGEISPEELEEITAWVKLDPENSAEFTRLSKINVLLRSREIDRKFDVDAEWLQFKKHIEQNREETTQLTATKQGIFRVFRPLQQGSGSWTYRVAAILLIFILPAFLYFYFTANSGMVNIAATTELKEITLDDGSRITLNKGATLVYPEKFSGSLREVKLTGEAWFEVQHDASKPFIVKAGNLKVEVLGTSFSVNENSSSGNQEVFLAKGKVRLGFADLEGKTGILDPGEVATVSTSNHTIIKSANTDPNIIAWKTRHIIFNNTPLIDAMNTISKVYGVQVKILQISGPEKNITATFDRQSPESVFHVLEATLDLQIRKINDTWEVAGK